MENRAFYKILEKTIFKNRTIFDVLKKHLLRIVDTSYKIGAYLSNISKKKKKNINTRTKKVSSEIN